MSISEYNTRRRKVWIDTDAGTDDAIALMIAMNHPAIDIVGISTVGGNVSLDCVTQNVLYIKELYDSKTSVYAGAAQPLERILGKADFIHGKDGLGDIGLPLTGRTYSDILATDALITALTEYQGELEVITLGPLTNLAKAIQKSPHISSYIKHCYIMGGLIEGTGNITPHAEFNIWADPEAAQSILRSDIPMTTIGWDTTELSGYFTLEEIAELRNIGTHIATIAADMQMVRINWQKSKGLKEYVTLADPTAMLAILFPECILSDQFVTMNVRGGQDDDPYRGHIDITASNSNHGIRHICKIDREIFKKVIHQAVNR